MNVIAPRTLREFWQKHPEAESSMRFWYNTMRRINPASFQELRETFSSADYAAPYTIFNVGGNNYRVIVNIHYPSRAAFIKFVLTHIEYNAWSKAYRKGQV